MEWISIHKRIICFVSLMVTSALSVYWYKSGILTDEIKNASYARFNWDLLHLYFFYNCTGSTSYYSNITRCCRVCVRSCFFSGLSKGFCIIISGSASDLYALSNSKSIWTEFFVKSLTSKKDFSRSTTDILLIRIALKKLFSLLIFSACCTG